MAGLSRRGRHGLLVAHLVERLGDRGRRERPVAGQQVIEERPEAVDVGRRADVLAIARPPAPGPCSSGVPSGPAGLRRRASRRDRPRGRRGRSRPRGATARSREFPAAVDQDVRRLEVEVDQALAMDRDDRARDRLEERSRHRAGHRELQPTFQGPARDQLEDQVEPSVGLTDLDRAGRRSHVGRSEKARASRSHRAYRASLPPARSARPSGPPGGRGSAAGLIDHAHAAPAQLAFDHEAGNPRDRPAREASVVVIPPKRSVRASRWSRSWHAGSRRRDLPERRASPFPCRRCRARPGRRRKGESAASTIPDLRTGVNRMRTDESRVGPSRAASRRSPSARSIRSTRL